MNQKELIKDRVYLCSDEEENKGIPLKIVAKAYSKLPRGSAVKLMFGMLALTGCRISELDRMRQSMIYGDVIHFKLGKNQCKQPRKVRLPAWFWSDYREMLVNEPPVVDRMFSISHDTFRRYFTHARPLIGDEWLEKTIIYKGDSRELEYRYQLKGLRKNYQTVRFANNLNKYCDSGVALEVTSKEMKHSSARITAYHYIQNFEGLGIRKGFVPDNLLLPEDQTSLGEWF